MLTSDHNGRAFWGEECLGLRLDRNRRMSIVIQQRLSLIYKILDIALQLWNIAQNALKMASLH